MSDHNGHGLWPTRWLALLVGVGIWLFASYIPRYQESSVPMLQKGVDTQVTYSLPSHLMILNPVQDVRVEVRGPEEQIQRLLPQDVRVQVPIGPEVAAGSVQLDLMAENVSVPESVEVVSLDPPTLSLLLDTKETRILEIRPSLTGEPSAGATLREWRVVPNEAEVRGPTSLLDQYNFINTAPINLDSHAISFSMPVAVPPPDALVTIVQPRTVTVFIELDTDTPTGLSDVSGVMGP